jgi:hypothetical protein
MRTMHLPGVPITAQSLHSILRRAALSERRLLAWCVGPFNGVSGVAKR